MSGLHTLTLRQYLAGVTAKSFSPAEVRAAVDAQIEARNAELNVYLARRKQRYESGPLLGVPLAVKDNFLTRDMVTTASAKVLDGYLPVYESTVTSRLRAAGADLLGKTNMDAWAHGSSTETSDYGPTKNPLNTAHMPGGSSGGSAAAVAADMCIAAIGSETAGSIRQPSAWCGTVGLKPTYGRVSRNGVVAMGSSLDSPGPMTKTVYDSALLLNVLAGQDPYDSTTAPDAVPDYTKGLGASLAGLRVGVLYLDLPELSSIRPHYEAVMETLRGLGAIVEETTPIDPHYAISLYTVLQRSEVSSNLARYDGIRYGHGREAFGAEAKRRIMLGTYTLSKGYADKYYLHAQKVRTLLLQDFARLFAQYDVLISPTTPGYALELGKSAEHPYFGELTDMLLEPSSISGLPGINVPCYRDKTTNLALGLNIMAPALQEERMLEVAAAYESATDWNPWARAEREAV